MNFRFGIVSQAKPGFAKVTFLQDDNFTTDWMPIVLPHTMLDKIGYVLNVKEHVACIMDEHCEEGVILGAIHSNPEPADTGATANKFRQVYADGAYMEYDKGTHKFNIQGSDGKKISDLLTLIVQAIQPILVIYGNNPDYSKLSQALTQIQNLFT